MPDSNESGTSKLGKFTAILFCIGLALFLVGFATDYWVSTDLTNGGLWRSCIGSICSEGGITDVLDVLDDDNLSKNYKLYCSINFFLETRSVFKKHQ